MRSFADQFMQRVAVLDDYDGSISSLDCWKKLEADFKLDFFSEPQEARNLSQYEVIVTVRERTIVDRKFLNEVKGLKHLALTGRLSGQADLSALQDHKIAVSYTDGSGSSAAELTIALILGITKRLPDLHHSVANGGWQRGPAIGLSGKTLGVLGLGRIGSKVAQFGKLMGMEVVSWGPTPDQGRSAQYGIQRLELDEVLKRSDIIAICLRLSDKTRNLLTAKELGLLKEGATLVNTARAEIIEKSALYRELESRRISAALDVHYQEPLPKNDPIRKLPNVLLTPHMGYVTREVYQIFFSQVVENILNWKNGVSYRNALTMS